MLLKKILPLLILFLCTVCSVKASQQAIKIGTIGIAPYGINTQGELSGLYYDLSNLIASDAGYHSSNNILPYARIIKYLKFGDIDLSIMFRYPELEGYVDYIAPLPSKPIVVIGLQGKKFKDIASLSGKKILYLRGAKFNYLIDNDQTIIKHLVHDYIVAMKMLMAGRADAIIGPLQSIEQGAFNFEATENKKVKFDEPLIIEVRTPWILMSKKSSSYIDIKKLQQSFMALEEKDTFNTLKAQYLLY